MPQLLANLFDTVIYWGFSLLDYLCIAKMGGWKKEVEIV